MKFTKRNTTKQNKRDAHVSDDIKHDILSSNILKVTRNFEGPSCKRDKEILRAVLIISIFWDMTLNTDVS